MPSADLQEPRLSQNSADQIVGRRRRRAHHPGAQRLRRRYPSAQIDWLVTPAIAELVAAPSGHHQRHRIRPRRLVEALDADAVCQLRAARVEAARHRLRSRRRHARPVPHRACSLLRPVRRCGSVSTGRAQVSGTRRREAFRPRRASTPGKVRARAAGSPTRTTFRCRPSISHAVDRYLSVGPMLGLESGPPDFSFPIPQAANARVDALAARARHRAKRRSSPWRRARSGRPSIGAPASLPRWRDTSCAKDLRSR